MSFLGVRIIFLIVILFIQIVRIGEIDVMIGYCAFLLLIIWYFLEDIIGFILNGSGIFFSTSKPIIFSFQGTFRITSTYQSF
mgnify:FL=1